MCRTTANKPLICVTVYNKGIQYLIVNGESSKQVCTEVALSELALAEYGIDFKELDFDLPAGASNFFTINWYRKG